MKRVVWLVLLAVLAACTSVEPRVTTTPGGDPLATNVTATPAPTPTPSATPTPTAEPTPTPAPLPLAGRVIVVDPGHNKIYNKKNRVKVPAGNGKKKACNSSGTATNDGWPEHTYNWLQANALADELRELGAKVVLTRENDSGQGPCVNLRAQVANDNDADLIISIHADGSYAKSARGFHVIISTTMVGGDKAEKVSKSLAEAARDQMEKLTDMPRSTYIGKGTALSPRTDIATLNLSEHPGIMMEMGNMRNTKDAKLLKSEAFRKAAAAALANAAVQTLS
ncbi:MAG: N-acetylmuramoyl-L-alanine amidase [Propionibacteriaceae bacterium]|nr:N-acetylmuramoyl-L-alanine amidase [Propionibacteriaceae bacterium]